MKLLSDEEIEEQILYLAGWGREGDSITKRFEFASFPRAIEFINEIAIHAERADHHPEIHNVYNRVTITLSTHDAGGITGKDTAMATQIEEIAERKKD